MFRGAHQMTANAFSRHGSPETGAARSRRMFRAGGRLFPVEHAGSSQRASREIPPRSLPVPAVPLPARYPGTVQVGELDTTTRMVISD